MYTREIERLVSEGKVTRCPFNTAHQCDGLCNNCPYEYYKGIEEQRKAGTYVPTYGKARRQNHCGTDYEDLILARQETYL